jgi:predicted HTH domain antitoxin
MTQAIVEIQLPAPLLQLGFTKDEIQSRAVEGMVLSLFTEGRISSGKAARLLSLSRIEFLAMLRERGIAYINYTPDELAEEFAAVDQLASEKTR